MTTEEMGSQRVNIMHTLVDTNNNKWQGMRVGLYFEKKKPSLPKVSSAPAAQTGQYLFCVVLSSVKLVGVFFSGGNPAVQQLINLVWGE